MFRRRYRSRNRCRNVTYRGMPQVKPTPHVSSNTYNMQTRRNPRTINRSRRSTLHQEASFTTNLLLSRRQAQGIRRVRHRTMRSRQRSRRHHTQAKVTSTRRPRTRRPHRRQGRRRLLSTRAPRRRQSRRSTRHLKRLQRQRRSRQIFRSNQVNVLQRQPRILGVNVTRDINSLRDNTRRRQRSRRSNRALLLRGHRNTRSRHISPQLQLSITIRKASKRQRKMSNRRRQRRHQGVRLPDNRLSLSTTSVHRVSRPRHNSRSRNPPRTSQQRIFRNIRFHRVRNIMNRQIKRHSHQRMRRRTRRRTTMREHVNHL